NSFCAHESAIESCAGGGGSVGRIFCVSCTAATVSAAWAEASRARTMPAEGAKARGFMLARRTEMSGHDQSDVRRTSVPALDYRMVSQRTIGRAQYQNDTCHSTTPPPVTGCASTGSLGAEGATSAHTTAAPTAPTPSPAATSPATSSPRAWSTALGEQSCFTPHVA